MPFERSQAMLSSRAARNGGRYSDVMEKRQGRRRRSVVRRRSATPAARTGPPGESRAARRRAIPARTGADEGKVATAGGGGRLRGMRADGESARPRYGVRRRTRPAFPPSLCRPTPKTAVAGPGPAMAMHRAIPTMKAGERDEAPGADRPGGGARGAAYRGARTITIWRPSSRGSASTLAISAVSSRTRSSSFMPRC